MDIFTIGLFALGWLCISFLGAGLWVAWAKRRNRMNEYVDLAEIDLSDLAGAVEADLRNFIAEQRTRV